MASQQRTLVKEITLCLFVKALLLFLLWWICYSHPVSDGDSLQKISQIFHSHG